MAYMAGLWATLGSLNTAHGLDMIDYFIPSPCCNTRNIIANGEIFYTFTATINGRAGFITVKNAAGTNYEEFNYDGSYIYHLRDTSWATGPNQNVQCDGQDAFFTLLDSGASVGEHSVCQDGWQQLSSKEGAKWVPRHMNVGQVFTASRIVVGFGKVSCQCCDAPYDGATSHTIRLNYQGPHTFPTGWSHNDVIILEIIAGAGAGETFYYARGVGWVGYDGPGHANFIVRVESGTSPFQEVCPRSGPPVNPPGGSQPGCSKTNGRVLDHNGQPTAPPGNTSQNSNPVQPGQVREAEHYWGMKGIDWAGNLGGGCNAGRTHLWGAHGGDLSEYLVNFSGGHRTLNVIGIPDDPAPVIVNVYVDCAHKGTVTWNDSDPNCNEGEGGNSQRITLSGVSDGVHAVAFEFANDLYTCPGGWSDECDRNFLFDYFIYEGSGGGGGPPPPSGTAPLHILNPDGNIREGLWITQCIENGDQRVWRVSSDTQWADYMYVEDQTDSCGPFNSQFGQYALKFRTAYPSAGIWITWCSGSGQTEWVWKTEGSQYAPFMYPQTGPDCP